MNFPKVTQKENDEFIQKYLKSDGILVLRIIAHNTNDLIMANLIGIIYQTYRNSLDNKTQTNNLDDQQQCNRHYMNVNSSSI